jgi:drug/metabolite transporter (DMT)-like permease
MLAVVAGLGAATAFAASTLASTRSSRLIGALPTVGWVTAVGLPLALVAAAVDRTGLSLAALPWLTIAGFGNVAGLVLAYRALRVGPVALVAPLVSTEGAVAALISIASGNGVTLPLIGALALLVAGGALTAAAAEPVPRAPEAEPMDPALATLLALVAASLFGASLYATAQIGRSLPIGWAALAPRVTGTLFVALPLAASRRLTLTRRTAPLVVVAGVAEVLGFACVGLGARSDVAITAVLASQFAAVAVVGAVLVFRERLGLTQGIGVIAVAIGTALVALLQA